MLGPMEMHKHTESSRLTMTAPSTCQECRVKKVKCDKGRPCSRCSMRGIDCRDRDPPSAPPPRAPLMPGSGSALLSGSMGRQGHYYVQMPRAIVGHGPSGHRGHNKHHSPRAAPSASTAFAYSGPPAVTPCGSQGHSHQGEEHYNNNSRNDGDDMSERHSQQQQLQQQQQQYCSSPGWQGRVRAESGGVLSAYRLLSVLRPDSLYQPFLASAQRTIHALMQHRLIDRQVLLRTLQRWGVCGDLWGRDQSLGLVRFVSDLGGMHESEVLILPSPHPLSRPTDAIPADDERLGTYLASLDDWTSALLVHVEDMSTGRERIMTNQHFARTLATANEIMDAMRHDRLLCWLAVMRFVHPENRDAVIDVYLRFLLCDASPLAECSMVVKLLERNGHIFYGKVRFRRETSLDRMYMAEIMSLSPLCEAVLPSPHDVASSSPSPTLDAHPTHGLPRSHTSAAQPRNGNTDNLRSPPTPEAVTMTGAWPALVPHGGHWTFAEAKAVFPPPNPNQGPSQEPVLLLVGTGECNVSAPDPSSVSGGLHVACAQGLSTFCSPCHPAYTLPLSSPSSRPPSPPPAHLNGPQLPQSHSRSQSPMHAPVAVTPKVEDLPLPSTRSLSEDSMDTSASPSGHQHSQQGSQSGPNNGPNNNAAALPTMVFKAHRSASQLLPFHLHTHHHHHHHASAHADGLGVSTTTPSFRVSSSHKPSSCHKPALEHGRSDLKRSFHSRPNDEDEEEEEQPQGPPTLLHRVSSSGSNATAPYPSSLTPTNSLGSGSSSAASSSCHHPPAQRRRTDACPSGGAPVIVSPRLTPHPRPSPSSRLSNSNSIVEMDASDEEEEASSLDDRKKPAGGKDSAKPKLQQMIRYGPQGLGLSRPRPALPCWSAHSSDSDDSGSSAGAGLDVLLCAVAQVTAKRQDEEQRHRFMTHARATQQQQ